MPDRLDLMQYEPSECLDCGRPINEGELCPDCQRDAERLEKQMKEGLVHD